jgi:hypothetical protein
VGRRLRLGGDGLLHGDAPLEHLQVLIDLERYGDFGQYGDLVKRQKSHRNAALIRLGVASEPAVRQRDVWGPVDRARPVTPRPPEPPRAMDLTG